MSSPPKAEEREVAQVLGTQAPGSKIAEEHKIYRSGRG